MTNNIIASTAKLGDNCQVGFFTVIGGDAVIGEGTIIGNNVTVCPGTVIGKDVYIGNNCVVGKQPKLSKTSTIKNREPLPPLQVGDSCTVGENSVLYAGTTIGNNSFIGDLASVRERCEIGSFVVIGRGVAVENDTSIGDYTKIQTGAYITAYMTIEDYVFIAPMVTATNDNFMGRTEKRFKYVKGAHIKRGSRVGGNAVLLPGVTLEEESFVAAGSIVTKDVPAATLVMGVPAKAARKVPGEELLSPK
ncbi:MAG: dTDP-3-amino-3,6-dideoxy-alpha-D-galactopyranose 3-N-acetyltransferase [Pelotomaculum sp. PtaU1.Bin065]|nr:MAG: dTDP-3-amino-3,6-dideoxy-alpha-D-galactopyranose 3-N-acetyltransferase [Pelotomaculum sp. PtaU1.Bin065]